MATSDPLVSIIMPVYNAERFLQQAIDSVLGQSYKNWELIIVDDGSTDGSSTIIGRYQNNQRILVYGQKNLGVSAARNIGLMNMRGDYFCFLDADDTLPQRSIEARLEVFHANVSLTFVDGAVAFIDSQTSKEIRLYVPDFFGNPLHELFKLSGKCFAGLSWMIKHTGKVALMNEGMRHAEDLLFLMELARYGGKYACTREIVLSYRQHTGSAMRNIESLEKGYWAVFNHIKDWTEFTWRLRLTFRLKVKKFMVLDYLRRGQFAKAFLVLIK
jgi:teichuronic acid biosynthesis glycosyltransferase TuaG